jgi:iron-sulfur cluster repair protein YtfE (RIC family)
MRLEVPEVLRREHQELYLRMEATTTLPGGLGKAARKLSAVLGPHLLREEQVAFPLLSLLPHIVDGKVGEEMSVAIPVADRLRRELRRLKEDHMLILDALGAYAEAARAEGEEEHVSLAAELVEHARMEEAILYPAALIIGEYVRLALQRIPAGAGRANRRAG